MQSENLHVHYSIISILYSQAILYSSRDEKAFPVTKRGNGETGGGEGEGKQKREEEGKSVGTLAR